MTTPDQQLTLCNWLVGRVPVRRRTAACYLFRRKATLLGGLCIWPIEENLWSAACESAGLPFSLEKCLAQCLVEVSKSYLVLPVEVYRAGLCRTRREEVTKVARNRGNLGTWNDGQAPCRDQSDGRRAHPQLAGEKAGMSIHYRRHFSSG